VQASEFEQRSGWRTFIEARPVVLAVLLAVVVVSVFVSGCSAGDPLDGTQWQLTEWTISSLDPAAVSITANFEDGQISGSSGVNTYGGPVEVGAQGEFAVGPLTRTEMAGPEPAMRAESAYLRLLTEATSYDVTDTTLTLRDAKGNDLLIFTRAAE